MTIQEVINTYLAKGINLPAATAYAASDIFLTKIAKSPYCHKITIKGGVLIYHLTRNIHRATRDLDFDFIHLSIKDMTIIKFINDLNQINDGISIKIHKPIEPLRQRDYHGKRVHILLNDNKKQIKLKIDIGIHSYQEIPQRQLLFYCTSKKDGFFLWANPNEQIVAEKLFSLAKLGARSTRYKDLYDIYYFISNDLLDKKSISDYFNLFFKSNSYKFKTKNELYQLIKETLNNDFYHKNAIKNKQKIIIADYQTIKTKILSFIASI